MLACFSNGFNVNAPYLIYDKNKDGIADYKECVAFGPRGAVSSIETELTELDKEAYAFAIKQIHSQFKN